MNLTLRYPRNHSPRKLPGDPGRKKLFRSVAQTVILLNPDYLLLFMTWLAVSPNGVNKIVQHDLTNICASKT